MPYFEDITEQMTVPRITIEIDYKRVILNAAASWDFMPFHHDPEFAREKGYKTIFLNTMFYEGFVDRVAVSWAGPLSYVVKRTIAMRGAIYAGETAYGGGIVRKAYLDHSGRGLVELAVDVENQAGVQCAAELTLAVPRSDGRD